VLHTLHRLIHGLAGSGETFGFPQLSQAARQCERVLLAGIESGQLQVDEAKRLIVSVLAQLDG
jgi:HPt (histidine-containing phosphotransfer) domain-containing protein